ncbi:NFX1-type zinc finger-containing protein 1 [Parasteatoda tepidariorum]|uniref:NFX1-type zinc finger-containing protein 1 n=1 Tax=Parasteatoda tepidariorum TaxID=114398 RepID=UPI001C7267CC|nr:NFX1-type zinc finger-containing protein 1-like [Parasteatoda tepidariorum]XP_042904469.1 NFX1-type zinc finger-containing protein 1-like [Parasteatoda tepidariorum]XP_042904470.1 NFX1-type zinc finger-containing protein 1-like [Parasteatoda tepidariorum]XP_042904471.1 NFX1-type zinc finger-containing protein 1-like [Parasteatoda tepidariorum]
MSSTEPPDSSLQNSLFSGSARGRNMHPIYNRGRRLDFPKNVRTENTQSGTRNRTNGNGPPNRSNFQGRRGFDQRNKNQNHKPKVEQNQHLSQSDSKTMSLDSMKSLLLLPTPEELLLTILLEENGFFLSLHQATDWDATATMLLIIGKALSACMQLHVRSLIFKINDTKSFLSRIQKYLISFHLGSPQKHHLDSLISLSSLLAKLQMQFPSLSSDLLIKLLPQLRKTCDDFLVHSAEYEAVKETLDDINNRNDLFLENFTPSQAKTMCENEKLQLAEPPENYRSIPVLPIAEDIRSSAFLRPNLVAGSYEGTEHYLDVQFRLLREDYVKPLRDGIAEYQDLKQSGKPLKNCKNVRVYEDVHIISQQYVNAGLVHIALFSDANFVDIKWEYSKRFLTGSLLCLTDDDFETMLFATVAERNIKKLAEGKLILRFEELTDEVLSLSPQRNFTVIETTAYFEAYRHNLKALSELDEEKLPMQRYIVNVEKEVSKPAYLNESTMYDFRPLLIPLDKQLIKLDVMETTVRGGRISRMVTDANYTYPPEVEVNAKKIPVLNDNAWPSCTELSLDPSQFAALKSAVTKEFAVIQGPPGTGKTYIGLRIVQLLLHNFNKNVSLKLQKSPILIVCYTNHALDQFLEGVSVFTQKIVRIGGRGKTEALEKFQLLNLKRHLNYKSNIPNSVFDNIQSKQRELFDLRRQIESKRLSMEMSNQTVLKIGDISECIPLDHKYSLISHGITGKNDVLHEWLGLSEGAVNSLQYEEVEFSESDEENEGTDLSFFPVYSIELSNITLNLNEPMQWKFFKNGADCKEMINECISSILKYCTPLSENAAHHIRDVSRLNCFARWQLYKYWVTFFIRNLQREYATLDDERKIKQEQNKRIQKRYMRAHRADLEKLNKAIAFKRNSMKVASKYVVSEEMLGNCIPSHQFHSLRRFNKINFERNQAIFNWLQLKLINEDDVRERIRLHQELQKVADYFKEQFEISVAGNHFIDIEEELDEADIDDIEYIEDQRKIDSEEFADVSFDLPAQKRKRKVVAPQKSEWKTQGGKKGLKKYIRQKLYDNEKMSEVEASDINDVWRLSIDKRWQLYKFWWQLYIENKQAETLGTQQKFRELYKELNELRSLEDGYLCQKADIVGMTTTGAAKYKHIIEFLNPKIVIVEEAAEILESHIVTSLAPKTQHVILIGDHQQLRPSPTVHLLSVKYNLNVSLFERMVKNGMECQQLKIQHRMRPDVARLLVPHIYKDLENHESVSEYENIKGFAKNVFFLSHSNLEFQEGDSKSKVNQHEARFLIKLCRYLILQNYDPSQITILTTYSGQLFEIKKLAKGILEGVRITVVDNFQGEENDIILVSFVRSNQSGEIGFLKIPNRICVALSRAKKGLYCIGNFQVLAENSIIWSKIIALLKETNSIGNSLELRCQNHPEMCSFVANENDFVQDGGCNLMCEFRLECGHVCPRKCHPDDQEHLKVTCYKPCGKSCSEDHPCQKKCFEKCGECRVPVMIKIEECGHEIEVACFLKYCELKCSAICTKILPCGHEINVACYRKDREIICHKTCIKMLTCGHEVSTECFMHIEEIKCLDKCKKLLSCGHICPSKCSENCSTKCEVLCKKLLPCGHETNIACYLKDSEIKCTETCIKLLPCGHDVSTECFMSIEEIKCLDECKKFLPCGHICTNKCSEICSTKCEKLCTFKSTICDHDFKDKCYNKGNSEYLMNTCRTPCDAIMPCHHFCEGTCGLCHQGRLHIECNKKCKKILICGHGCESICSKSCPPCKKWCTNWCDHNKCSKRCGELCDPCYKPCTWACIHKRCSRLCHELCDRTPCDKNCPEILECGHACLGYCGEPCPEVCKICDPENELFDLTEKRTLRSGRVISNEKYILLEDCNHVFESEFLSRHLNQEGSDSKNLRVKSCPKCETVIRKNFHFGNLIKSYIIDVRKVKLRGKALNEQTSEVLPVIRIEAELLSDDYSSLKSVLSSKKNKTNREIMVMKNFIKLILMFENVKFFEMNEPDLKSACIPYTTELISYMKTTMSWIFPILRDDYLTSSDQQMQELNWEIVRLTLISKFFQYFLRQTFTERTNLLVLHKQKHWSNLIKYIKTYKPFRDSDLLKCTSEWAALSNSSFRELNVEKIFLTRFINYSLKQWQKCKFGHLYFAECDEETFCHECG